MRTFLPNQHPPLCVDRQYRGRIVNRHKWEETSAGYAEIRTAQCSHCKQERYRRAMWQKPDWYPEPFDAMDNTPWSYGTPPEKQS